MSEKKKVLLAFSGGLDTSYCAKYLAVEQELEVHSAIVNTGGFTEAELQGIAQRAHSLGVASHVALERTEDYYRHIIRFLIFGNVLRNGTYPLSVSAERIYQAIALAEYAKELGVDFIAHGSTGAGNDQVRFDLVFQLLVPEIGILTPVRDQKLSRKDEIDYLAHHGLALDWKKAQYSVNKGLWGTSVGGAETLTSHLPLPDAAFTSPLQETAPRTISLDFVQGEPVGLNGERMHPVQVIQQLDVIASRYAIGRDIHVGDTIIGIKGRVGFEAAASGIIIKAHHTLEKHVLSKWQQHWKQQLGDWYGMFIHEAQYFEPSMRNIEAFLESSQENVNGTVTVQLHPYRYMVEGVTSPHDLMKSGFGEYGEMNNRWSGEDVKGFTKILANPMLIHRHVAERNIGKEQ